MGWTQPLHVHPLQWGSTPETSIIQIGNEAQGSHYLAAAFMSSPRALWPPLAASIIPDPWTGAYIPTRFAWSVLGSEDNPLLQWTSWCTVSCTNCICSSPGSVMSYCKIKGG